MTTKGVGERERTPHIEVRNEQTHCASCGVNLPQTVTLCANGVQGWSLGLCVPCARALLDALTAPSSPAPDLEAFEELVDAFGRAPGTARVVLENDDNVLAARTALLDAYRKLQAKFFASERARMEDAREYIADVGAKASGAGTGEVVAWTTESELQTVRDHPAIRCFMWGEKPNSISEPVPLVRAQVEEVER